MADPKPSFFQAAIAKAASIHTMTGLASLCGVERVTLTNYATGRSRPSREALRALSDNLPPAESGPLILAHLLDECPASARPYLTLELAVGRERPEVPNTELDALIGGIRLLAEERQEVRDWLSQSYAIMR
jgi:transcriptional regulator with XRE-family HTH domain